MQASVNGGTKVDEKEFIISTELLMVQLLKLDSIEAEGEAKTQRKNEVCWLTCIVLTFTFPCIADDLIPIRNGLYFLLKLKVHSFKEFSLVIAALPVNNLWLTPFPSSLQEGNTHQSLGKNQSLNLVLSCYPCNLFNFHM